MSNQRPSQAKPFELIERHIHAIRGHKVMLDSDLAELYGVATKNSEQGSQAQRRALPARFHVQAFESGG